MKTIRNIILILIITALSGSRGTAQLKPADYLPGNVTFNKNVPAPADILGFDVGERQVSHDLLVQYFTALSKASARVKYETYGRTHEGRPLTLAIISSEENIKNIEEIRNRHLGFCDPNSQQTDPVNEPVVVWLSHSIHGNETSGANSSMLTAYYFAAGTGNDIEKILSSTIILIDPATNPDGLQRFSTWANSHKSYQGNADPLSREHLEVWPGGRSNHYWFDLNRDWLPVEQPESENRVKKLMQWKPNILVDLHEMGSNSTFHFSPGEPKRVNPLIPADNQELTAKLAEGYAKAFDEIGSLYFSAEQFDDYYIGRGPTFMDMNGGVALLFEQASSRGFEQDTENGRLTFPFTIKNQLTGALSTITTANRLRKEFVSYQRNYYITAAAESKKSLKKGYVFGSEHDRNTTYQLAQFLNIHGIKSYLLKKDINTPSGRFTATNAYVVPLEQQQYRLIESIFETRTTFADSIFYDVSAWNMPMAYNMPFEPLDAKQLAAVMPGEVFSLSQKPSGTIDRTGTAYAYLIEWEDYNAPAALYKLLSNNIIVKTATAPVETTDGRRFERGSLVIPMGSVNSNTGIVESTLAEITGELGINVIRLTTGDNRKIDLGSPTLIKLDKPKILILTEEGVSGFSAGQLWHQFDTRYNTEVTLLPSRLLASVNLYNYNTLILPDGSYQWIDAATTEKIRTWAATGNTIIGFERASLWLSRNKFIDAEFKQAPGAENSTYEKTLLYSASREVPGTIYEIVLDLSHPLNFGFTDDRIPVYKDNSIIQAAKEQGPLNYPARYSSSPLLSGYSPRGFAASAANTPAFSVFQLRQGRVIAFYNNPVFRAYWRGTNRFLANAVFFGKAIRFSQAGEN